MMSKRNEQKLIPGNRLVELENLLQWELAWTDENGGLDDPLALPASLEWRQVAVPCSVQNSLFGLPSEKLYQRDNIQSVAWMTANTWFFRTTFDVPAAGPDEEALVLFKGIDYRYRAESFVDGESFGYPQTAGEVHPMAATRVGGQILAIEKESETQRHLYDPRGGLIAQFELTPGSNPATAIEFSRNRSRCDEEASQTLAEKHVG
jgi:hypothetical protein